MLILIKKKYTFFLNVAEIEPATLFKQSKSKLYLFIIKHIDFTAKP